MAKEKTVYTFDWYNTACITSRSIGVVHSAEMWYSTMKQDLIFISVKRKNKRLQRWHGKYLTLEEALNLLEKENF